MGGHGSGGLFLGTRGARFIVDPASFSIKPPQSVRQTQDLSNPVIGLVRTGSALKTDPEHAFPDIVDNYAGYAEIFRITGGDGRTRLLLQIEGSLNGVPGVFEWIVDSDSTRGVTHRRFIRHGTITGKPNQRPKGNKTHGGI